MQDLIGKRVAVYFNLRRRCWSIRHRGLVVGHCDSVTLHGAHFVVSEAGRQRVLKERRKNVHAYVVGTVGAIGGVGPGGLTIGVSYNPYKGGTFVRVGTGEGINAAPVAHLDHGRVWV